MLKNPTAVMLICFNSRLSIINSDGCGFRDSMTSQATAGKKKLYKNMRDSLENYVRHWDKLNGQIHSGRVQCYTIKLVVQTIKSIYDVAYRMYITLSRAGTTPCLLIPVSTIPVVL